MSLFLLTFFLLYGGTHVYFFLKLTRIIRISPLAGLLLALLFLALTLAPVLVRLLEESEMESAARLIAYVGYFWMAFLFLFFSVSLLFDVYHLLIFLIRYVSRRDFSACSLTTTYRFLIPCFWGILVAIYGYFEARSIRTERIIITTNKLPKSLGMLTIVQVSDVHLGLIVRKKRLANIIKLINDAAPDIVVSTGDLVDGQMSRMTGLAELLQEVRPRYGKFAIIGNHEFYAGLDQALVFTKRAGFRTLRNEGLTVGGVVNIAGIDDPAAGGENKALSAAEDAVLSALPRDKFTLLIKHRPVVEKKSFNRVDLQLSGHVHKGQIFPFSLVTYLFYPVKIGLSIYPGNTALYVSRGTGTWGPPIRFLAPPEVTVIEVNHAD